MTLHLSKHGSWFCIAEYELSVLSRRSARRVPDQPFVAADVERVENRTKRHRLEMQLAYSRPRTPRIDFLRNFTQID